MDAGLESRRGPLLTTISAPQSAVDSLVDDPLALTANFFRECSLGSALNALRSALFFGYIQCGSQEAKPIREFAGNKPSDHQRNP
jgi:hypothetical protein